MIACLSGLALHKRFRTIPTIAKFVRRRCRSRGARTRVGAIFRFLDHRCSISRSDDRMIGRASNGGDYRSDYRRAALMIARSAGSRSTGPPWKSALIAAPLATARATSRERQVARRLHCSERMRKFKTPIAKTNARRVGECQDRRGLSRRDRVLNPVA